MVHTTFFTLLSLQTKIMKKIKNVIKHKFRLGGKTHFVSVSIFKDKTTTFVLCSSWIYTASRPLHQNCDGAGDLPVTHSVLLFVPALREILSCPLGFVLWDTTDTVLRKTKGKKSENLMLRSVLEVFI